MGLVTPVLDVTMVLNCLNPCRTAMCVVKNADKR